MKGLLLTVLLSACSSFCGAQQYNYQFQVGNVDNIGLAKPLVAAMREHFNTPEEPRRFSPKFDDAADQFIATSALLVTEEELTAFFQEYAYELSVFERTTVTIETQKEDE